MPKGYGSVAASVAHAGIGKVPRPRKPKKIRPTRPYTRKPRQPKPVMTDPGTDLVPRTQTPTVSGTGVTTVDGGTMPGAPSDLQGLLHPPAIKNYNKAPPGQIAAGMLAPQYASLYAQQHQQQLMSGQQRAAITGFGGELAKILGAPGPGGVKGTLGPDYAAALSMSALRNFAYQQFLTAQGYADKYAEIAAQSPTLINQIVAQRFDQNLKLRAFNLQELVAQQTYHLNQSKAQAYNAATGARLKQSQQRITLSQKQYNLSLAKAKTSAAQWNLKQTQSTNKIDLQASKAAGKWVNSQGQVLTNVPFKNPPPPYYKPSKGTKGGGPPGIDRTASKELGYWVYDNLNRVPLRVSRGKGLPDKPPGRYKPGSGPKNPGLRGLTQTQYRNLYGDAVSGVQAAKAAKANYNDYVMKAISNGIPRWVAQRAWNRYGKGK